MGKPWSLLARRERTVWAAIVAIVSILAIGGIAVASSGGNQVNCLAGADLNVHPDGTWSCGAAPTATQSSEAPSPSPSVPPTSPSLSTTTPPATTPAPTTPAPTTSSPPGPCPVAGSNVPGAADPWGGCWPGPGNTGVPAGITLTPYSGPCTITAANTVIDAKLVTCSTLSIHAPGVVIRNSKLQGTDVNNAGSASASFTITDSTVINGFRDQCACIGYHDFTATRVEVIGGNRSMYCELRCTITDSWLHGQQLQGSQHGSGLREEQYTTATHNALTCDFPFANDATTLGCSAALTGYADFAPIHDNTIRRNLFLPTPMGSFCAYGGATGGKPFSSSPLNGTNQVFVDNVFSRGDRGKCAYYGPITDFDPSRPGNVWTGNVWADSGTVSPG